MASEIEHVCTTVSAGVCICGGVTLLQRRRLENIAFVEDEAINSNQLTWQHRLKLLSGSVRCAPGSVEKLLLLWMD